MEGFKWGAKTVQSVADRLSMRQIGEELTEGEEAEAKANNFLIIFGYSDDVIELRGAIHDEISLGDRIHVFGRNVINDFELEEDKKVLIKYGIVPDPLATIECSFTDCFRFIYLGALPNHQFYIFEGLETYCIGIVIDLGKSQGSK
jgi:hypothetical protein